MRVGLNLLYLIPGVVGGTETYARNLIDALAGLDDSCDYVVFTNGACRDWPLPTSSRFSRHICGVDGRSRGVRYVYEQAVLPTLARRLGLDVLHSLGYVAPLRPPCASTVTIHDTNFLEFGDGMALARRHALRVFVGLSAKRCDLVIAQSHFTAAELNTRLRVPADKLRVVHLAAKAAEATANHPALVRSAHGHFVVFSSGSPNKNLPALLRAFNRAVRQHGVAQSLVVLGHIPPQVWAAVDALPSDVRGLIEVRGYVDEAVLSGTLCTADGLLFPSLYEGFGLPVLEAMALGVPVACSRVSALPEVAGNAALYFSPGSEAEMAEAIWRLAQDPELRGRLAEQGRARAATFSWRHTAERTRAVYAELARGPKWR